VTVDGLIPVRLEEVAPKFGRVADIHWVDPYRGFDEGVAEILRSMGLR
jgi:hypothetical protein